MPHASIETATAVVRIAFIVGALTDGLAIIPMLSSRASAALFGGDPTRGGAGYRYAMRLGASLMAGWTLLLVWGVANPLQRRDLLIITVFPVVIGIAAATIGSVRAGVLQRSRVLPLLIHLSVVSVFYIIAYVVSAPFAP